MCRLSNTHTPSSRHHYSTAQRKATAHTYHCSYIPLQSCTAAQSRQWPGMMTHNGDTSARATSNPLVVILPRTCCSNGLPSVRAGDVLTSRTMSSPVSAFTKPSSCAMLRRPSPTASATAHFCEEGGEAHGDKTGRKLSSRWAEQRQQ